MKVKECINYLNDGEYITLQDKTSESEITIQLNEEFYSGKNNINKLSRFLVEQLEIKEIVAKNTLSVGLYEFLSDPDILTYANDNLSKSYGRCDSREDAAKKMAFDIMYYLNIGADKFCSRVLECFDYAVLQKKISEEHKEEKSYYLISVSYGPTAGEGYEIAVAVNINETAQDAKTKALKEGYFESPDDANFINYIQKIDKETYFKLMGYPMETFKIPVAYQAYGYVEVQSFSLKDAVKYAERHLDELPLPKDPQYLEDSYQIDYDGIAELNKETDTKNLPLTVRIAEADNKKSTTKAKEINHEEYSK